jgi:hypothetical protein
VFRLDAGDGELGGEGAVSDDEEKYWLRGEKAGGQPVNGIINQMKGKAWKVGGRRERVIHEAS